MGKAINEKVAISEEVAIVLENGPDGFTATADLDTEEERAAKPVKTRTPRGPNKPKTPDPAQEKLPLEAGATETAQEGDKEPVAEQAPTMATDAGTATQTADAAQPEQSGEADAAVEEKPAEDETIPDKPKSLFAGLAKPKN